MGNPFKNLYRIVKVLRICYFVNLTRSTTRAPSLGCLVSEINYFDYKVDNLVCQKLQISSNNVNIILRRSLERQRHRNDIGHQIQHIDLINE